jgi:hypothetical protein
MHRVLIIVALAAVSLFGFTGVALAGDPDPVVPPAFSPPTPGPVTDEATAETFAKAFVARNAGRFLRSDRRRVRVLDANAKCLQSPVVDTRFGCVFTLRALVISRSRGWDGWDHHGVTARKSGDPRGDHGRRHFRIRNYGCLGFLRINGGPTVTPSVQVPAVECGRVPRGDIVAPEPTS